MAPTDFQGDAPEATAVAVETIPRRHNMLDIGSVAPAFTANDQHGNEVSLTDYSGKWVAMWRYPKASTPG
jgi:hypothetical protein